MRQGRAYVRWLRAHARSDQQIRQRLEAAGWAEEDVMALLGSSPPPPGVAATPHAEITPQDREGGWRARYVTRGRAEARDEPSWHWTDTAAPIVVAVSLLAAFGLEVARVPETELRIAPMLPLFIAPGYFMWRHGSKYEAEKP